MKYATKETENYLKMDWPLRGQPDSVIRFVRQHSELYRKYYKNIEGMHGRRILSVTVDLGYQDAFNDREKQTREGIGHLSMDTFYLKKLGVSGTVHLDLDHAKIVVTPLLKYTLGGLDK